MGDKRNRACNAEASLRVLVAWQTHYLFAGGGWRYAKQRKTQGDLEARERTDPPAGMRTDSGEQLKSTSSDHRGVGERTREELCSILFPFTLSVRARLARAATVAVTAVTAAV